VEGMQINSFEEAVQEFQIALERNEEGIILKDMNSFYHPSTRSADWIKMKGDYFHGLSDNLDVLIIGGYFG
jgi:ATP-dependent DNA ligase